MNRTIRSAATTVLVFVSVTACVVHAQTTETSGRTSLAEGTTEQPSQCSAPSIDDYIAKVHGLEARIADLTMQLDELWKIVGGSDSAQPDDEMIETLSFISRLQLGLNEAVRSLDELRREIWMHCPWFKPETKEVPVTKEIDIAT